MACLFFFDDEKVLASLNAARKVHQPVKCADNPIMIPQAPWETPLKGLEWPTVMYDEEDKIFKIWYEAHFDGMDYVCYAISNDGIKWERPNLGLFEFKGSKKNNICLRGVYAKGRSICPNVIKRDSNDWHMYYWDSLTEDGLPGVVHYQSTDGLSWRLGEVNPVVRLPVDRTGRGGVGDVLRVSYDKIRKRFLLSQRALPFENLQEPELQDIVPGGLPHRRVVLTTSQDGHTFKPMKSVLVPDLNDPPDLQFYALSPFRFRGVYLGYLQCFRTNMPGIDVELAYSKNGTTWKRVLKNARFIPTGRPPNCDCGILHPNPYPVQVKDKHYIYYFGSTGNHKDGTVDSSPAVSGLCMASVDPDRMVSINASQEEMGKVLIGPLRVDSEMCVNADVSKGELKFSLRDPDTFKELAGFEIANSDVIKEVDSTKIRVSWSGGLGVESLRGKKILIQANMSNCDLFSINI